MNEKVSRGTVFPGLLGLGLLAGLCFSQTRPAAPIGSSLCFLQAGAIQGSHRSVRVDGMYSLGLDLGILSDSACPIERTWVELDLHSKRNREKLRRILDRSRAAYVVFEGELYGPPLPDPKLPDDIRKIYQPGWGHLGAFKTKLLVHAILRVAKPSDQDPSSN